MKERLLKKIQQREITVGVVGLGYVGLPLAVEKAMAGYRVIGFDVQEDKVRKVKEGINYIGDVVDQDLKRLTQEGMLCATNDFSFIQNVDFVAICVPTPLDEHQQPDMTYVRDSALQIARYLKKETIVVLESTTYPGTTEELLLPILEQGSGLKCGKDFYLGFSPERVDPGNLIYKTKNTPKVVGGVGQDAGTVIAEMYRQVLDGAVLEVSSPKVAEMEKLLENTYRHINIGLANEMAIICEKMGINVWEVIEAAKTKPYGFQAFYPGPGLGGHCIPLDPYYLVWKAREFDYHASLIEASGTINDRMPEYIVERSADILNDQEKPLKNSVILVLGAAYKQDIADYRESPALKVMKLFRKKGCLVQFFDPFLAEYRYKGETFFGIPKLTEEIIKQADLVVITTAHTNVDYEFVQKHAKVIFDTKNAGKNLQNRANIILL